MSETYLRPDLAFVDLRFDCECGARVSLAPDPAATATCPGCGRVWDHRAAERRIDRIVEDEWRALYGTHQPE